YGFGFAANNRKFTVANVSPLALQVAEPLTVGEPAGTGDEALVTQGSRGVLLDRFMDLRRTVDAQAQLAQTAYQALYGVPPGTDCDALLDALIAQAPTPPSAQQSAELFAAYLGAWRGELDDGIRNWGEVGLASTKGLFDAQARRDLQNDEG